MYTYRAYNITNQTIYRIKNGKLPLNMTSFLMLVGQSIQVPNTPEKGRNKKNKLFLDRHKINVYNRIQFGYLIYSQFLKAKKKKAKICRRRFILKYKNKF